MKAAFAVLAIAIVLIAAVGITVAPPRLNALFEFITTIDSMDAIRYIIANTTPASM